MGIRREFDRNSTGIMREFDGNQPMAHDEPTFFPWKQRDQDLIARKRH
jgi:hypothetical protein